MKLKNKEKIDELDNLIESKLKAIDALETARRIDETVVYLCEYLRYKTRITNPDVKRYDVEPIIDVKGIINALTEYRKLVIRN